MYTNVYKKYVPSPTTNGGTQKWKLGRNAHALRTRLLSTFPRPTCVLSRCLVTKISASELGRKLVKSALLVGYYGHAQVDEPLQVAKESSTPLSPPPPSIPRPPNPPNPNPNLLTSPASLALHLSKILLSVWPK